MHKRECSLFEKHLIIMLKKFIKIKDYLIVYVLFIALFKIIIVNIIVVVIYDFSFK